MAFSSPIFRKIFLGAFVLFAATLLSLGFYLARGAARWQMVDARQRLQAEGQILSSEIERVPAAGLEAWVMSAAARAETRITILDPQGEVLADSGRNPRSLNKSAPEVQQARQGKVGAAVRYDAARGCKLCYLAMPIQYGGEPGWVLELALPVEDIPFTAGGPIQQVLGALLAAAALALGAAYLLSRSFSRRIMGLKRYAENLAEATFSEEAPAHGNDELSDLGRSLERTATRLHQLLDRLNLESAQREGILDSMVEGVLAVDADLRVTFCNNSFLRAVSASGPPAERSPLLEIVREPSLMDLLTRVLASKQSTQQRLSLPGPEGRSFEIQVSPLQTPSGAGALAIFHDITDLERLERVRRDFVANVSHELRTPLTAIQGYAETLLEGGLEDEENNRKFVEIIKAHATRLGNIASDLLRLSELETDRLMAEPEPISVRAAFETALRTVEPEARLRGVTVLGGHFDDLKVMAERGRLEQVFVNLLDNAVKFNRLGGEVRVEVGPAPEGKTRIVVADTGIGIPSTDLSRIFERFYRVDKTRSREMGGTGLGLSIVRHLVERMKGTVSAESQLGKGSAFTVLLPSVPQPSE